MPISDLISTSFLFSIAIIIILIGGIFAYVSYRMSEQDHKLTSMLGLVSALAETMHSLKIKHNNGSIVLNEGEDDDDDTSRKEIHIFDQNMLSGGTDINLISVSDNESESNDSGSESDSESDSDSNGSESSDSDEEPISNVKILNISDVNELINDFTEDNAEDNAEDFTNDFAGDLVEDLTEEVTEDLLEDLDVLEDLAELLEDLDTIKSIHLAEPIELLVSDSVLDISDLKTIMISDKPDYKKMGLNKLREVVVERNIISVLEAGKLKKPELLKLLDDKE
jgi:hypothetical protein